MDGTKVKEEVIKVLGLKVDNKGTWEKHINNAASEARMRMGALKRIQHYFNDKGLTTAYKAFVRSRLEYGNLVYWRSADTHLKKLDRVQRSFSKTLENPSWIPTLEERRKAAAVGLTCKLLDNKGRGQLQSLKPTFLNDENNVVLLLEHF